MRILQASSCQRFYGSYRKSNREETGAQPVVTAQRDGLDLFCLRESLIAWLIWIVSQEMNARSQKWFEEAKAAGMRISVAYLGTTVIDSWGDFWQHTISEKNLSAMMAFGLEFPEAASHRWSIMSGPCPWHPQEEEKKELKRNPRYSALDMQAALKK